MGELDAAVAGSVAEAHRNGWSFVLAAAARITRDLDTAEECAQDAFAQALAAWAKDGIPAKPAGWVTTVARRRAMDLVRRKDTLRAKLPMLVGNETGEDPDGAAGIAEDVVPDDRLRLIFTCCHPSLSPDAQAALTLRLVCGLSTAEVARAFLVPEATMAARITRAKKKIAAARIPYRVPDASELPERVEVVADVVHLLYTTGHIAPVGDLLQRRDLAERALHLARVLHGLLPDQPAVAGLLALILITDARRHTRTGADGALLRLADQDRTQWDHTEIGEGVELVSEALKNRPPSRYVLMAAIAAVHAEVQAFEATDWVQIAALYDELVALWPSPVVALNRAVAVGHAYGPLAGLALLDELCREPQLARYHYLAAARGELLARVGRAGEARVAYQEALVFADNAVEREFLEARLAELE